MLRSRQKILHLTAICLLSTFFIAIVVPASVLAKDASAASEFYISPDGNDQNAGSLNAPFATLAKAVSVMTAPGDTLYVRGGTYFSQTATISQKSGTAENPYRIRNYPGETPVFDGDFAASCSFFLRFNASSRWRVEGLEIRRYRDYGIRIESSGSTVSENLTFEALRIHNIGATYINSGCHGIYSVGDDDITVKGCEIFNIGLFREGANSNDCGVYLRKGCTGWTLDGNKIFNIGGVGIMAYVSAPDNSGSVNNCRFQSNLIYACHDYGMLLWSGANRNVIANNTFYGNGIHDLSLQSSSVNSGNAIYNNLFTSQARHVAMGADDPGRNTFDHNMYVGTYVVLVSGIGRTLAYWKSQYGQDEHSLMGDAGYMDPDNGDFRTEGGDGEDRGGLVYMPEFDFAGAARSIPPDIGAYENGGRAFYLAPNGNDQNAGSLNAPFATLAKAVSVMTAPGDTLYVRGGTYFSQTATISQKSGTTENPYRIKNYPGETPVFDGDYAASCSFFLRFNASSRWRVEGLEIKRYRDYGLRIEPSGSTVSEHLIFEALRIHDIGATYINSGCHGIYSVGDDDITVKGCEIFNIGLFREGANSNDCGVYLRKGCTGWTLEGNRIFNIGGAGIIAYVSAPDNSGSVNNGRFANNVIYACHDYGMILWSGANNNVIANNTFYGNGIHDLSLQSSSVNSGNVIYNNLFTSQARHVAMGADDPGRNTFDHNLFAGTYVVSVSGIGRTLAYWKNQYGQDEHSIMGDAGYMDPDNGDFRTEGGDGEDRGGLVYTPEFDFTGATRNAPPDIGAYESGGRAFYLAPDGNDQNSGSLSAPFATLEKAVSAMAEPGDTLVVRGGTYLRQVATISQKSGTAENPYRIKNYPSETPVFDGEYAASCRYLLQFEASAWWRVEGLEIRHYRDYGVSTGVLVNNLPALTSEHLRFENLRIHDNSNGGFASFGADNITVRGCSLYNFPSYAFYLGWGSTGWKIDGCSLYNARAGIHGYHHGPNNTAAVKDCFFTNNLIYWCGKWGITLWAGAENNIIANNTFYGNGIDPNPADIQDRQDLSLETGPRNSGNVVYNNLFTSKVRHIVLGAEDARRNTFDYNLYVGTYIAAVDGIGRTLSYWQGQFGQDKHSLIGEPGYIDPDNADFRTEGGDGEDMGGSHPDYMPELDFSGAVRSVPPDIGAYEG